MTLDCCVCTKPLSRETTQYFALPGEVGETWRLALCEECFDVLDGILMAEARKRLLERWPELQARVPQMLADVRAGAES